MKCTAEYASDYLLFTGRVLTIYTKKLDWLLEVVYLQAEKSAKLLQGEGHIFYVLNFTELYVGDS